ncbi:MAG: hypothetical protein KC413_18600 [Anaerolineales bacterium]|nr:hypothetical protein [Anaerolineales bacterium]MCA9977780.1 hypothetical protein [Anaerolineales bacterium]
MLSAQMTLDYNGYHAMMACYDLAGSHKGVCRLVGWIYGDAGQDSTNINGRFPVVCHHRTLKLRLIDG